MHTAPPEKCNVRSASFRVSKWILAAHRGGDRTDRVGERGRCGETVAVEG